MRRFLMCAAVIAFAWAVNRRADGDEDHAPLMTDAKAMKAIGSGFGEPSKAIQSGAMADARMGVASAKGQYDGRAGVLGREEEDDPAMIGG